MTQKSPRLIQGLSGKPARWVSCGNRHSGVVTMNGELYTMGEGDYGRLGGCRVCCMNIFVHTFYMRVRNVHIQCTCTCTCACTCTCSSGSICL